MHHPISDFRRQIGVGEALCLLPISRVLVEEPLRLQPDVIVYPPGIIDPASMKVIVWPARDMSEAVRWKGGELVWFKSAATGIDLPEFFDSALVATVAPLDWTGFLTPRDHRTHLNAIARVSEKLEAIFDLVRLHNCRPWVPQELPGRVGYLEAAGHSTALFYTPRDDESFIVAGELLTHIIKGGVGLDMTNVRDLPVIADGEVGQIARHVLRLLTAALEANTETSKFIQFMSLLEYLAYPADYKSMDQVKSKIGRHVAKTVEEFETIKQDFRRLSSEGTKSADGQPKVDNGLRHNIVHLGRRLEDLIDEKERVAVFRRLYRYAGVTLGHLIQRSAEPWTAIEALRVRADVRFGFKPTDGITPDGGTRS